MSRAEKGINSSSVLMNGGPPLGATEIAIEDKIARAETELSQANDS